MLSDFGCLDSNCARVREFVKKPIARVNPIGKLPTLTPRTRLVRPTVPARHLSRSSPLVKPDPSEEFTMKFQSIPVVRSLPAVAPLAMSSRFGTKPDNERDDDDEG